MESSPISPIWQKSPSPNFNKWLLVGIHTSFPIFIFPLSTCNLSEGNVTLMPMFWPDTKYTAIKDIAANSKFFLIKGGFNLNYLFNYRNQFSRGNQPSFYFQAL